MTFEKLLTLRFLYEYNEDDKLSGERWSLMSLMYVAIIAWKGPTKMCSCI